MKIKFNFKLTLLDMFTFYIPTFTFALIFRIDFPKVFHDYINIHIYSFDRAHFFTTVSYFHPIVKR